MANNPKLLSYIEDKIKALIETRVQKLSELEVDDALSATSENPVQNKVIKAALDDKLDIADIDDTLSASSENPVQNKVIKAAIDAIPGGTVDTAMSDTSENAVQNKVIKDYVDNHMLVVDSALDSTSSNPVQNSVIYESLYAGINIPVSIYSGRVEERASPIAPISCRKTGNVFFAYFDVVYLFTPGTTQTTILYFDSQYAPSAKAIGMCMRISDGKIFIVQVSVSGNINIENMGLISSGDRVAGFVSWMK